ncbi:hypothetical protein L596_005714 [Steinernema carpocapsae]|uniref:Uncharacterized protein n=1 Tax=Steinernema carpocapsae TaxID=34508 RepID=A0A4U8V064_STECR|nr:hypothetical protein L596_005714 [Steinernema carpocapsae]
MQTSARALLRRLKIASQKFVVAVASKKVEKKVEEEENKKVEKSRRWGQQARKEAQARALFLRGRRERATRAQKEATFCADRPNDRERPIDDAGGDPRREEFALGTFCGGGPRSEAMVETPASRRRMSWNLSTLRVNNSSPRPRVALFKAFFQEKSPGGDTEIQSRENNAEELSEIGKCKKWRTWPTTIRRYRQSSADYHRRLALRLDDGAKDKDDEDDVVLQKAVKGQLGDKRRLPQFELHL